MNILETDKVSKVFGGLRALDNVSIKVEKGEIRGIIGPNGSGKTTFLNVITGFYKPTNGKVIFKNQLVSGEQPYKIAQMGMVRTFQNINLFKHMTVLENIMTGMFCRARSNPLEIMLKTRAANLEENDCIEKATMIAEFVGLKGNEKVLAKNLPYGQQRLLEIGRALASDPDILLLDEPVAGMNDNESREVSELILKLQEKQKTIILIEHHMRFVMLLCEKITVLNSGKVIAEGLPEYVQSDPEVIRVYLGKRKRNA